MNFSKNILLSDFFRLNVRCDLGLDHGFGILCWMHPPVHRVLGWASKPSFLNLSRNVWRLDQLKGVNDYQIYVTGKPSVSDQATLDRFPTLINANLLNKGGEKIATIVDLVFESMTGKILYYLVSRSSPKIPGSSRWSLKINHIKDQQPGMVLSDLNTLNDLPLIKASVKEEILIKSQGWRTQIKDITNRATHKLEGWLEESAWEEDVNSFSKVKSEQGMNWVDNMDNEISSLPIESNYNNLSSRDRHYKKQDNDPWI